MPQRINCNENYDDGDCDDGDDNDENCYIPYEYHVFLVKKVFQEVIVGYRAEHFPAGQVDKSAKILVEIFVMRHGFFC